MTSPRPSPATPGVTYPRLNGMDLVLPRGRAGAPASATGGRTSPVGGRGVSGRPSGGDAIAPVDGDHRSIAGIGAPRSHGRDLPPWSAWVATRDAQLVLAEARPDQRDPAGPRWDVGRRRRSRSGNCPRTVAFRSDGDSLSTPLQRPPGMRRIASTIGCRAGSRRHTTHARCHRCQRRRPERRQRVRTATALAPRAAWTADRRGRAPDPVAVLLRYGCDRGPVKSIYERAAEPDHSPESNRSPLAAASPWTHGGRGA